MVNTELGNAAKAYVEQTFGFSEVGVGYVVIQDRSGLHLSWDRAETQPTDEQLEAALNKSNWDNVRKERNELLAATDFYALSDVTMSDDMATYRQDLRDLPASTENSEDVVWPTKPQNKCNKR